MQTLCRRGGLMTEQEYEVMLRAIADVQVVVDALGLDVQDLRERLGDDDPAPPLWVNGSEAGEDERIADEHDYRLARHYPPAPPRGGMGGPAAIVVIGCATAV